MHPVVDNDDIVELSAVRSTRRRAPRQCFVVHGEPLSAHALRDGIREQLGWRAEVPALRQTVGLA
ncbi:MAG: MBL fold metallo-hydrolase RNA specificity domain-containing protein [Burkholderiales bacterium]